MIVENVIRREDSDMAIEGLLNTDLAVEERERFERNVEIPGVILEKSFVKSIALQITRMDIINREGEENMGKPIGTYVTMESPAIRENDPEEVTAKKPYEILVKHLVKEIKLLLNKEQNEKVLLVGLGNKNATPDALGPKTIEKIIPGETVMCIAPGVLAQTGMETFKIVKGIVSENKPDKIIVVDSLAARNARRLGATIQITDTGIIPGSGIGNYRMGINKETVGVDVIAIGVPMVVKGMTIVHDVIMEMVSNLEEEFVNNVKDELSMYASDNPTIEDMYVTPKDVDEMIERLSNIIAEGINRIEE